MATITGTPGDDNLTGTDGGDIVRISNNASGVVGDQGSVDPVFSTDGHMVAFESLSDNLVPGDTNGQIDVFVRNLLTGAITRISTAAGGGQGDAYAINPVFSHDGAYVAFQSHSDDLVPGDTNGSDDIFVKNLASGAITRVSTDASGGQSNGDSSDPVFSPDGKTMAFVSVATNLTFDDTNGHADIFIKTLATGAIVRASKDAAGDQANGSSGAPVFSPDSTKVAFESSASNLVPGDTNGAKDIFIKTLSTGAITLISSTASGVEGNGNSSGPVFSADGTKVAFTSDATNLVPGDTNGATDVFVKNLTTGAITLVSSSASGVEGSGASSEPIFSPDGTKVAFASLANNLVPGDTNTHGRDIFVKDLVTGAITLVSTDANGAQGQGDSQMPTFSPDGSHLLFQSTLAQFGANDTNKANDIYIKNLDTGADTIYGGGGNDVIHGLSGDDALYGGLGDDKIFGGPGNDTIDGGAGINVASYADATSGVTVNLAVTTAQNTHGAGVDTLANIENLIGSRFNDVLTGDGSVNGLNGGAGDDVITGHLGADILTGGLGADRFVYLSNKDSNTANGVDVITDFSHAQGDRIDVSAIDADVNVPGDQSFHLIDAFTHTAGEIILVPVTGGYLVEGDINGDAKPDLIIDVQTTTPLVSGDFIL